MKDRDLPWQAWAFVVLLAAVIASPIGPRLLGMIDSSRGHGTRGPAVVSPVDSPVPASSFAARSALPRRTGHEEASPAYAAAAPALPDVSSRLLDESDLAGRSAYDLDIMRNEIYARHGRRFRRRDLQAYFDAQPWYRGIYPPNAFPEGLLTPVEHANADRILRYQKQHF